MFVIKRETITNTAIARAQTQTFWTERDIFSDAQDDRREFSFSLSEMFLLLMFNYCSGSSSVYNGARISVKKPRTLSLLTRVLS